jgi:hypothetical protein
MPRTMQVIEELKQKNQNQFLKRGSQLSYSYSQWIVARDRKKQHVLVGGLGGTGCGEMWFQEEEYHKDYTGYKEAPERTSSL